MVPRFSTEPRLLLGFALALLFAPAAVHAQEEAPSDETNEASDAEGEAASLTTQGIEARRSGDDGRAVTLFLRAYELAPTPRRQAQLGLAEQGLGQFLDAETHLAAALSAETEWIEENRAALEDALERVRQNVGRFEILGGVRGATVRLNGVEVATLPMDGPQSHEIGEHTLEVEAEGYYTVSRALRVLPNDLTRLSVESRVREAEDPTPPTVSDATGTTRPVPPPPPERQSSALTYVGVSMLVVGGLAMGAAIPTGLLREAAADRWNDDSRCLVDGMTRGQNCGDDRDDAQTLEAVAYTLLGAGAGVAAIGIILIAADPGEDVDPEAARVACAPGLFGVQCEGRF